ncbi:MAG: two-component regulator propeller domain-containing protein [Rhodothermales bacterium]
MDIPHPLRAATRACAITLLVALGMGTGAGAQPAVPPGYVLEHWTVEDGLPVNAVTAVKQDRHGYLWVATFDGLVRFDGDRFTVFDIGDSPAMYSNRVSYLVEASDGGLWLNAGLPVRFADGRFTTYGPDAGLPGTRSNVIYEDPGGTLWVGTNRGVARYADGRFHPLGTDVMEANVWALFRDSRGALWGNTADEGLWRYQGDGWEDFTGADGLAARGVAAFAEAPDGAVWIATTEGISRYRDGAFATVPVDGASWPYDVYGIGVHAFGDALLLSVGTIGIDRNLVLRYEDGRLRLVGRAELDAYVRAASDRGEGEAWLLIGQHVYHQGRHVTEVPSLINGHVVDAEGNLWLGMDRDGLYQMRPALFTVYGSPEGLTHDNLYPVFEARDGTLWAGSLNWGVNRIDRAEGPRAGQIDVANFTMADGLAGDIVRSVYEDRDGTLWVGTWDGLTRFEGGVVSPEHATVLLPNHRVEAILQDRAGRLWFGTSEGLYRYENGVRTPFTIADGLAHNHVRVLLETRDGALWAGTNGGGLSRYHEGRFHSFTTADGLSSDLVRALYEGEDGILWVGTEGRGLTRLDLRDGLEAAHTTVYLEQDGLFDGVIHQILDDGFGRLWMSTNRGIFWVERAELDAFAEGRAGRIHSTGYTERDGLRNREANGGVQSAGIRARDGRLWFPTQAGLAVVDPARVQAAPVTISVERIGANGARVPILEGGVALPTEERSLDLAFTAPVLSEPDKLHFQYRLEGLDAGWIEAGARHVAHYARLPPGTYAFHVRAYYKGQWSELAEPLAVTVAPLFYETWWFAVLCGLGAVGLLHAGYRARVRQLRRRQEGLEALVRERTRDLRAEKRTSEERAERLREVDRLKSRFFTNVSHEFRTPLTLTICPLEDVQAEADLPTPVRQNVDLALRNSRRLLHLINQLLDVAKLEVGEMRLEAQRQDLGAFLSALALAFVPLAERRGVRFEVDLPGGPVPVWFDGEKLEQVVGNLLSNAFKFTPEGGAIRVVLERGDGAAVIGVRDSGPGIAADVMPHLFERFYQVERTHAALQAGTGIGLSLAKELTELHGGRLVVESVVGFGSTFTLTLPLGRDHLRDDQLAEPGAEAWVLRADRATLGARATFGSDHGEESPIAPGDALGDADDRTTVLVVDDNPDLRTYVRGHLEGRYRVLEAADGAEALRAVREALPDLVVSDVMMPEMDGFELVRALHADRDTDFIPVILLTAKATADERVEGLGEGADDYLTKPFHPAELKARVDNLIASRQKLKERFLHGTPSSALPEPSGDGADVEAAEPDGLSASDHAFVDRVRAAVEARLADEDFTVEELAEAVSVSRSTLHARLRAAVDESPSGLIRTIRLERAAGLLRQRKGTVSEVAYAVGFKSVSYFSQAFRAEHGTSPSAYADEQVHA